MRISSEQIRNIFSLKKTFVPGEIAEKSVVVLIFISLFFTWIYFPLSTDSSSFQTYSQLYFSYGSVLLILLILLILGLRTALPLIVLVIFSFPLILAGNFEFIARLLDELNQLSNLIKFAKAHIYEPNIVYYENNINPGLFAVQWDSFSSKLLLVLHHLGFGYLLSFLCSLYLLSRLKFKQLLFVASVLLLFLLPTFVTNYFLGEGKEALLKGEYVNAINYLNKAKNSNHILWNGTLSDTVYFNLELGEAQYRGGYNEGAQSNFYKASIYGESGSFQKALNLYRLTTEIIPTNEAIADTMIKKSFVDIAEKRYGSSYALLNDAYSINPNRIETIFYLQYLSSILNDNNKSIDYGLLLTEKCGNKVLLSDVYNMLAKAYSELGQNQLSKDMYKKSLKYYDSLRKSNYPAWEGLAGW